MTVPLRQMYHLRRVLALIWIGSWYGYLLTDPRAEELSMSSESEYHRVLGLMLCEILSPLFDDMSGSSHGSYLTVFLFAIFPSLVLALATLV